MTEKHMMFKADYPAFMDKSDSRYPEMIKQIEDDGWCTSELWALNNSIAMFILPRLKSFRERMIGVPVCYVDDKKQNDAETWG